MLSADSVVVVKFSYSSVVSRRVFDGFVVLFKFTFSVVVIPVSPVSVVTTWSLKNGDVVSSSSSVVTSKSSEAVVSFVVMSSLGASVEFEIGVSVMLLSPTRGPLFRL